MHMLETLFAGADRAGVGVIQVALRYYLRAFSLALMIQVSLGRRGLLVLVAPGGMLFENFRPL